VTERLNASGRARLPRAQSAPAPRRAGTVRAIARAKY